MSSFSEQSQNEQASPMDLDRLKWVLEAMDVHYVVDEDLPDVVIAPFEHYVLFMGIRGKNDEFLFLDGRLKAEVVLNREAQLAAAIAKFNRENLAPRVVYRRADSGRFQINFERSVSIRAGLSDRQLFDALRLFVNSAFKVLDSLAEELPELKDDLHGATMAFGEENTTETREVDFRRAVNVLKTLDIEDMTLMPEHDLAYFTYRDQDCRLFFTHGGQWMIVRTQLNVWGPHDDYLNLIQVANSINSTAETFNAAVYPQGEGFTMAFESNFEVGDGMTAAQLYVSIMQALVEQAASHQLYFHDMDAFYELDGYVGSLDWVRDGADDEDYNDDDDDDFDDDFEVEISPDQISLFLDPNDSGEGSSQ